ncbi:hypothetical protein PRIPAC_79786 [Pristionchus pacificus]|uniref:Uncharacterized protein n=1 Tax=Pristionchus pacificus TaxID=54126 RepID=A0A2A6BYG6_PRIPA|nr:hypothetical protein PRIPAC_79786 [Pristionchus pacificus]|eukprot:PDM70899.1 hypothetical protein PRIPAC_44295 [Pristionchus pacificus]
MLCLFWIKDLEKPASNSNILVLRFCVTQFGINASPSILNKVIHLQTMSMNLRDYDSNDLSFLSIVPDSDRAKDETQKILGLLWGTTVNRQMTEHENFTISIDRYAHLSDSDEITLVAFSDVSKQVMAACIYRSTNAQPNLLISKTRLEPIKCTSTIPKMELDSLVMAHTLVCFTVEALRKELPDKQIHVYVSPLTQPKQPGVFVANRFKKIHDTRDELASFHPVIYHCLRHIRSVMIESCQDRSDDI